MSKELVIIYDTPDMTHTHIMGIHNLVYYFKFFDKIRVLYWSKEKFPEIFERGKFVFYPYCKPYNSGYITGLKYMNWIGKTLWRICKNIPKDAKLILMPVIPIWAGLPTLIVGKIKRKKVVLRLEAEKAVYLSTEAEIEKKTFVFSFFKIFIVKIIYFLTLPLYDYVIALSEGILKEAEHYGAKKIVKIPILIDLNPFLQIPRDKTRQGFKTILYVGQIKEIKGIFEVIEAIDMLKGEDFEFNLLIVGGVTNPKDEMFLKKIKKTINTSYVQLLGFIDHKEISTAYEKADIFVLPSYSEALGMAIMEAMASGLPVIATKTSGAKDLVLDGKTGFLVPIKDEFVLKEKIKILLENSDLRESMGRAGRKRIEELIKKADENNKRLWQELL